MYFDITNPAEADDAENSIISLLCEESPKSPQHNLPSSKATQKNSDTATAQNNHKSGNATSDSVTSNESNSNSKGKEVSGLSTLATFFTF